MKTIQSILSSILFCFVVLVLTACTMEGDNILPRSNQVTLQQLTKRVQYLEDMTGIQKLQARYAHLLLTQRFDRIMDDCFARKTDDVSVEFSDSGVYRGAGKVRALYSAFDQTKKIPGFFIMHVSADPVIEIAQDGHTAKSHWLSPGASGSDTSASWIWGLLYVDYIKEEGEWRIQHTNFAPIFRNKYEVSWAQAAEHGTVRILSTQPDAPPTIYRPYNEVKKETDIFRDHPDLP